MCASKKILRKPASGPSFPARHPGLLDGHTGQTPRHARLRARQTGEGTSQLVQELTRLSESQPERPARQPARPDS
jgi:hypothetical protein